MSAKNQSKKNRPVARAARMWAEALETRTLMSGSPTEVPGDIAGKIDERFYQVSVDVQHDGRDTDNAWVKSGIARVDNHGNIQTYLHTTGDPDALFPTLRELGIDVEGSDRGEGLIQAWVPADKIDDVARLETVRQVEAPVYAIFNTVTSAGDGVLKTDKVRSQFAAYGIDGTGIKVGVISDGAAHRLNVGAELPSINVDPSHPGSGDEGTAMLEIVHDLAPGAQLYFSGVGGGGTALGMKQSIEWLTAQGCNVIVDDVTFFDQGFFTDTLLATAAQTAVNAGVTYVTAAGNQADHGHWQGMFKNSASLGFGGVLHQFGSSDDDVKMNLKPGDSFRAFLEWSDAWGASANDYDMYLYDGDTFTKLDDSKKVQNGTQNPWEMVSYTNNTNKTIHMELSIVRKTGAASRELELFTVGNSTMNESTAGDTIIGQGAVPGVLTVGAVSVGSPSSVEAFSSQGGSTVYSNFNTQTKATRNSIDGVATDGVQTSVAQLGFFAGGSPFFYGTSAAAPHAAAIVALLKQMKPTMTPAQASQLLTETAVDIGAPNSDMIAGAGRFDALAAMYRIFGPTIPVLAAASDTGISNSDKITNDTTPTFTGTVPLGSYVHLWVDGIEVAGQQLAANTGDYSITTPILLDGDHQVSILVAADAGVPLALQSIKSAANTIKIDTVPPTVNNMTYSFDAPHQTLSVFFSGNIVALPQPGDFLLQNLTTNSAIPAVNIAVGGSTGVAFVTFPGYTYGALPDGNYHVSLNALGVTDAAGNPIVAGAGFDFFVLAGDANHDRNVDFQDLVAVAQHYDQPFGQDWVDGDFTADGLVTFEDLVIVAQKYGTNLPDPAASMMAKPLSVATPDAPPTNIVKDATDTSKKCVFNTTVKIAKPKPAVVTARRGR